MNSSKYKLTLRKSLLDYRDWRAETIYSAGPLPTKFSLEKTLSRIKDQGSFGTCAAQTAACIKESQEYIEDGLLEDFSPMFVYAHRTPTSIAGMYPRDVMKIMQNLGGVAEQDYPYKAANRNKQNITTAIYEDAKNYTIKSYASISTIDAVKRALIADGPVFVGLPVFNFGNTFWKANFGDDSLGGHAVAIVGYDKKGFTLRNSWGTSWGDYGYGFFPYKDWGVQWEAWTTIDDSSFIIDNYKYKASQSENTKNFVLLILEWILNIFKK